MRAVPVFSLVLLVVWVRVSWAFLPGDSNVDGHVSAPDIPTLISILTGAGSANANADANGDGVVNAGDLDATASLIFSTPRLYCDTLPEPLPIPDNDPDGIADTITVPDATTIADLELRLNVTHTFVGDLAVILTHVDAETPLVLLDQPGGAQMGCDGADIACTLDDQAERAAQTECAAPPPAIAGHVRPLHPLSTFAGQSIGGTWKLAVFDLGPDDTGTLDGWCLQPNSAAVQTGTPSPTPSPTPTNLHCDTLLLPARIPDNDPNGLTNTITVADSTTIADLNVPLDITHTFVGDLVVTLTHADTATTVTLIDRPGIPATDMGCDGEDIACTLDDQADHTAEDECFTPPPAIAGRVQPFSPLSAFAGQSIGGTWRLQVSDLSALDVGTLDHWCLEVNSE